MGEANECEVYRWTRVKDPRSCRKHQQHDKANDADEKMLDDQRRKKTMHFDFRSLVDRHRLRPKIEQEDGNCSDDEEYDRSSNSSWNLCQEEEEEEEF